MRSKSSRIRRSSFQNSFAFGEQAWTLNGIFSSSQAV
jgi:hypothetical protein